MSFFIIAGVAAVWTSMFGDFHPKKIPLTYVFYETFFVLMSAQAVAWLIIQLI